MENKELGLLEIKNRIKDNRVALGITSFRATPSVPITEKDMPCVVMLEEADNIVKRTTRNNYGYPCQRVAEVVFELITDRSVDIKQMYRDLRKVIFTKRNTSPPEYTAILADNVFIYENRTEGPTGYGLPDVTGMRLVLDLIYTDIGF